MLVSSIAAAEVPLLEQGFYVSLNWLGQFVRIIIESVGMVGVGVIVFTLILKAITTPFDIYQRVKMRKQTLIMRKLQPELEKLQKQYANDKTTYQMKIMELQKKNGYSILGACLPMIISFVILIVAITAFQSYASYANLAMYESMARGYDEAILAYAPDGGALVGEGEDAVRVDYRLSSDKEGVPVLGWEWEYDVPHVEGEGEDAVRYTVVKDGEIDRIQVESVSEKKYLYYTYEPASNVLHRDYYIDVDKLYANQKDEAVKKNLQERIDAGKSVENACLEYVLDVGSEAAAATFRGQSNPGFLWVKNVWYPDVSYNHPIQDYESFQGTFSRSEIFVDRQQIGEDGSLVTVKTSGNVADVLPEASYNSLISKLGDEMEAPNGYFVMIVISIGLMVLSQFVMMKSQKESDKFQTVDGQGARTQKVMMVAMPLIFAIFGFLWSAAFTIYNVISSVISIVVTLLTNFVIGKIFDKKEEEEIKQRYTRTVPWKKEEPKKQKKSRK